MRVISQGPKRFFATIVNKLDFVVALVCFFTLAVYIIDDGKPDSFEEVTSNETQHFVLLYHVLYFG